MRLYAAWRSYVPLEAARILRDHTELGNETLENIKRGDNFKMFKI